MGKKRQNLGGLSFFAQLLNQPTDTDRTSSERPPTNQNQEDAGINVAESDSSISGASTVTGSTKTASRRNDLDETLEPRASKKRKNCLLGPGKEKYDATGLVPYYTETSQVPEHLQKYFFQRERYFSLYSSGCLLDEEGWYSVTPELIAAQIAERCRCDTILDAFCGVGGNTIAFAQKCERVIAIDNSPTRLALARHNAAIYGVEARIEFILGDYVSFAKAYLTLPSSKRARKIDVVFLSPPWGGPQYLKGNGRGSGSSTTPTGAGAGDPQTGSTEHQNEQTGLETPHPGFSLAQVGPIHGADLFKLSRQITKNVAYFLPRNTNMAEVSALLDESPASSSGGGAGPEPGTNTPGTALVNKNAKKKEKGSGTSARSAGEMIEVEEEWMGPKLKALTCYFGGLVAGQEDMFDQ